MNWKPFYNWIFVVENPNWTRSPVSSILLLHYGWNDAPGFIPLPSHNVRRRYHRKNEFNSSDVVVSQSSSVTELASWKQKRRFGAGAEYLLRLLNFCLIVSVEPIRTFPTGVSVKFQCNISKSLNQVHSWSISDIVIIQTVVVFQSLPSKH